MIRAALGAEDVAILIDVEKRYRFEGDVVTERVRVRGRVALRNARRCERVTVARDQRSLT
jgi:hypothetical protein